MKTRQNSSNRGRDFRNQVKASRIFLLFFFKIELFILSGDPFTPRSAYILRLLNQWPKEITTKNHPSPTWTAHVVWTSASKGSLSKILEVGSNLWRSTLFLRECKGKWVSLGWGGRWLWKHKSLWSLVLSSWSFVCLTLSTSCQDQGKILRRGRRWPHVVPNGKSFQWQEAKDKTKTQANRQSFKNQLHLLQN